MDFFNATTAVASCNVRQQGANLYYRWVSYSILLTVHQTELSEESQIIALDLFILLNQSSLGSSGTVSHVASVVFERVLSGRLSASVCVPLALSGLQSA